MQTLAEIKSLLEARGLRPKRSLGQNFLTDQNLILKLVRASGLGPGDCVLEVGPGTGTLTEALLDTGARVVCSELDDALVELLRERLGSRENFTLVHGDCLMRGRTLNLDIANQIGIGPFALAANLPYGCASPLLSDLLLRWPTCTLMVVTVQKELVDRLLAKPRTREYGPISIIAQAACEGERIASMPPECFWPRPKVDSAMARLRRREEPLCDLQALSVTCGALFRHRRKRIAAPLRDLLDDEPPPEGVSPDMRAEEVQLDAFVRLAEIVAEKLKNGPRASSPIDHE